MNKKRVLLTVLAMVLVCALSVAGTLALLAENGGAVVNTFVAAGGDGPFIDEDEDGEQLFALKEIQYTQNTDGTYTPGEAVTGAEGNGYIVNQYKVMPGTTIPKTAFVTLRRTAGEDKEGNEVAPAPAYLFIEVKSELSTVYTWRVDTDKWMPLNIKGSNGGDIYVMAEKNDEGNMVAKVLTEVELTQANANILNNNAITVSDKATATEIGATAVKMEFYAYLSQSTVAVNGQNTSDAVAVFNACFPDT